MEKKFTEAIYPAYRPASARYSAEELTALHAAYLIEDSFDAAPLFYAEKRCGLPIPKPNKSARVVRRRMSPSENLVIVRASATFFRACEEWWTVARPFEPDAIQILATTTAEDLALQTENIRGR